MAVKFHNFYTVCVEKSSKTRSPFLWKNLHVFRQSNTFVKELISRKIIELDRCAVCYFLDNLTGKVGMQEKHYVEKFHIEKDCLDLVHCATIDVSLKLTVSLFGDLGGCSILIGDLWPFKTSSCLKSSRTRSKFFVVRMNSGSWEGGSILILLFHSTSTLVSFSSIATSLFTLFVGVSSGFGWQSSNFDGSILLDSLTGTKKNDWNRWLACGFWE